MAKKRIYRFKGTEGSIMPEAQVRKWIQTHQDHHEVKGHFYGKEILQKILDHPGVMGIRIYHAIDDKGKKQLILIGADAKGNDMWPSTRPAKTQAKAKAKGASYEGEPVDMSMPCPPFCSSK